ncbi:uncharacterized protein MYCFIDRAFT_194859 [Pseudocercospora fijiensis CIRAD86]|uniref:N-acetyltransferase domain-containing protein n=1 Tax=Pseudocercospora fijiensis (strain CIRAD86) TaxID=383855 RepID=M3BCE1_PSEFD|nr:uncharacterized protein MYCFIDRAFT_194859 [Pseudocercospora fijiensis CIRAD86]EME86947.1 hypothetical protein MYCFIDRAFT_194859 [Pseudocercospora fijiensis CIRAD86]
METQIVLRWARREDIPYMTEILKTNFLTFEFHDHFCPTRRENQEEFYNFLLRRIKQFFMKPECRYMVAEATTPSINGKQSTEIVGFASWEAQGDANIVGQEWRSQRAGVYAGFERMLGGIELEYYRYFLNRIFDYKGFAMCLDRLHSVYEGVQGLDPCMHLQFLMVAPKWQRGQRGTGVGKRLFQWGVDVSEKTGIPLVIESSLLAYNFYLKNGCKLLKEVRIDLVPEKAYDLPVVWYEPKKIPT